MSGKFSQSSGNLQKVPERAPLFLYGAMASGVYLVAVSLLAWNFETSLFDLKPNELGDYLAGVFSPLAFLWLVLGFLQQGQELRIQAIELNNSVEQSRQLVEVTRDQLALDREAFDEAALRKKLEHSPQFRIVPKGTANSVGNSTFKNSVENVGGDAIDMKCMLHWSDSDPSILIELPRLEKGNSFNATFGTPSGDERAGRLIISFKNIIGQSSSVISNFNYDGKVFAIDREPYENTE